MPKAARARTRRRLTGHFVIEEFDSHDGVQVGVEHYVAFLHLCDWLLEPLRADWGACTVHSGFRSFAHNARVNGASQSVHLLRTPLPNRGPRSSTRSAAADVSFAVGTPHLWAATARAERHESMHLEARGRGGVGTYGGFVHLDTGPLRDWRG